MAGTIAAGWRMVRTIERRASSRDWVRRTRWGIKLRPLRDELALAGGLFGLGPAGSGAFQRAAGLGEEDVVEAGGVELEVGDPDPIGVEGANDVRQLLGAVFEPDRGAVRRARNQLPEAVEDAGDAVVILVLGRNRLDGRTPDLGLELLGACPRRRSCRGR